MISQVFIMVFGAAAIWFVSRTEKWKRWGYIFGLISQPFWFYTAFTNEQWGIFVISLFYSYSWIQGIWNYWLKPHGVPLSEIKMKNIPPPKKPFTENYADCPNFPYSEPEPSFPKDRVTKHQEG